MAKLYEIANDYAKLMGEDCDIEMIQDTVDGIEGEFTDKVEHLIAIIKNESALADMLKVEAKNLTERAKNCEARVDGIKQYIISCMQTMEKSKINAGIHSVTVRKPPVSVSIDNIDLLPANFVEYKTTASPNKNLIKERLKLGESVSGASLVTGKLSLLIK